MNIGSIVWHKRTGEMFRIERIVTDFDTFEPSVIFYKFSNSTAYSIHPAKFKMQFTTDAPEENYDD